MADEYRDERALERFWEGLFAAGEPVTGGGIPPELADALRRVHALGRTPPPAGVSERLDGWMLSHLDSTAPSKESFDMLGTQALPYPGPRIGPNGHAGAADRPERRPPARPARRAILSGISWLTAAALIAVTFALIFFVTRDEQHGALPPARSSPANVATPDAHAWPVWGGNAAHTFVMPGPAPREQPVLLWKYPADGQPGIGAAPDGILVADGVAYLAGSSALVAVDAASGAELWRSTEAGGSGAIDGDGLIMRSSTATATGYDLLRISRKDGSIVWRAEQGQIPLGKWAPVLADGLGFTPSGADLLAFDPATGNQVWRAPLANALTDGPVAGGGIVVTGDAKGTVTAFNAKTGAVVWSYQAEPTAIGGLSLAGGTVHFTTTDGTTFRFHTLDAATGAFQNGYDSPANGLVGGAAVTGTIGYVMDNGALNAFDLATGAVRWIAQTDATGPNTTVLAGDTIVVAGADGLLYAIDVATGSERWRFDMGGRSDAVPTVVDGVIYVSTGTTVVAVGGAGPDTSVSAPDEAASPTAGAAAITADTPQVAQFVWQTSGGSQPFTTFVGQVTVAPDGRVWVADGTRNQFQIFNPDGTFAEAWGTPGSGDGQFNFIRATNGNNFGAVAFAPDGSFYVADLGNFRIQKFDKARKFLFAWGSAGTADGQFLDPEDLGIDASGNVFVVDGKRDDVQKFAPDGAFLLKFGGAGKNDGQLDFPGFMAVDPDGNVWVTDSTNGRIEIWANDGTFLASWTGGGAVAAAQEIAVDAHGRAYVTETDANFAGVVVLDRFGRVIGAIGGLGTGSGYFTVAAGVALDNEGNIYITDMLGPVSRVQKFKLLPPLAPA